MVRYGRRNACPMRIQLPNRKNSANQGDALFHAKQAQAQPAIIASPRRNWIEPTSIVVYRQVDAVSRPFEIDRDSGCAGMLGDVRDRFLRHAIQDQLDFTA